MRKATRWRVTVCAPRARDGRCWVFRIKPPTGAVDENGKPIRETRRSSGTEDRAEADAIAAQIERDLNPEDDGGDPRVVDVLLAHEEQRPNLADDTREKLAVVREHVGRILGDLRASKLDRAAVLKLQDAFARMVKPGTVNCYMALVGMAWRWARERDKVTTEWPRVRRLKKQDTRKRPFTVEETALLLRWVRSRSPGWLPLFKALSETGARVGEVLAARQRDLDRTTGALLLLKTKTKVARTVYMAPETAALFPELAADAPLFQSPARRGHRPTRHAVVGVLRRFLRDMDMYDGTLDVHSFRRAWIADAERAGVARVMARRLSGHASEEQYLAYERHAIGDDLAAVSAALRAYRASQGASQGGEDGRTLEPVATGGYSSSDRATLKPMFR